MEGEKEGPSSGVEETKQKATVRKQERNSKVSFNCCSLPGTNHPGDQVSSLSTAIAVHVLDVKRGIVRNLEGINLLVTSGKSNFLSQ